MRITAGCMLAALMGLSLGCGGKSDPPPPENKGEPAPAPGGDPKPVIPAAVPATWEMDPAKHAIPTGPVSGTVNGDKVTLEAQAEKQTLTFLLNKGDQAVKVVEIVLSDPSKSTEEYTTVVKPDQKSGLEAPNVIIYNPANQAEPPVILQEKYALTLKLGRREKGKLAGSIHLSLPDSKKSFVAGTFSADWIRTLNELPGADDAPFIQGKATFTGAKEPDAWVGYVRIDPHDPVKGAMCHSLGTMLKAGATEQRSPSLRPPFFLLAPGANPANDPARYELTRLEPGYYWVFAYVKGGPVAWKFATIEPGSQLTVDFNVDASTFGSLAMTVPGTTESVSVVPKPEAGKSWPDTLVVTAASITDLYVNTAANKPDPAKPISLNFPRLAPGKYEVWSGDSKVDVEIKAKETAKVDLKKK